MQRRLLVLWMLGSVGLVGGALAAGEKGDAGILLVVDHQGKEHKVKNWKITKGVRHLMWLAAEPEKKEPGKKGAVPAGPEALEMVEGKLPPLKKGVLTYVPLASIRSIEFDGPPKDTMTVRVARSDKEADDEILVGPIGYVGINHLAITAPTELGELGKATVEFLGGVERGIRGVRFPAPQPIEPLPEGRVAVIKQASKKFPNVSAVDLQPLYQSGTALRTQPYLYFKDTIKVEIAKVASLAQVGSGGSNFEVTLRSGQQNPLVLVERPKGADGKSDRQLVGLVGRFSAGYRMIPMIAIGELHFEEAKK